MKVVSYSEYCLGCGLCRIHCAAGHDGYNGNILKAYKRGTPRPRADLIFHQDQSWLNTCQHCPDAPCVNACITGALQQYDRGVVYIDEEICVSCYTCIMVCPYGHIFPGEQAVLKCDLCRERPGQPACVAACPNGALRLVNEGETA
ncbi:MAG TPA: 4Fe-4S binding protein [Syntrophomonadaceae bacterium]|nr:4Fe-4S binding protein [Syntrophomonadaceae bacterium]HOQ09915.1 4Fe-4S binding protein [Syntrophomonadaceae bacterium]HPU48967.1 4Fe-4S binding protein [Syntrophomonadaceae bacterium]